MARSRHSKEELLARLNTSIKKSASIVFASVKGLNVHELEDLRRALRSEECECLVAKKTLLTRAFAGASTELDFKRMDGEIAAIFGYADQVAPARVLSMFGKAHEDLKILEGLLIDETRGVQQLTASAIYALALLPSRKELRARLVGSIASPLRNLVGVVQAPLRGFVQVLNAYAQTKI